uniref:hypothetical protein n=1 Tax=Angelakisella sp. TaxID=1935177 RepID=UPI003FED417D
MKKRLLSALLALALVFVLLPTTALADTTPVTDENVKINGTAVIVGNDISLGEGNGTYSYDKATHTLTLNSATITTTGNIGISFGVPVKGNIDYKIELIGTNTISSTSAQAIYVEYDSGLDQQGTQKLSTLTINGSAGSQLILNASGYEKEAIWSKGDFTLSGGTAVTAFSSGKIAVNVGSMTINNSKLSAQSSSYGTTVVLYGLKMIGDTAEFEALNTSSVVSAVLGTSGASENTDWSNYQFTTGSYSGGVLTKSDPEVCSRETLNKYLGLSQKEKSQYIHIAKRTIPALQRTPDVLIAGENAVVSVETSIPSANGSGTYFYDQASKTLTLKDVNIASSSIINGIQFTKDGTYTINLVGTNTMSGFSTGISANSADQYVSNINITITGAGSLEVSTTSYAIAMNKGDLKFENTGAIKLATGKIGLNNNALSVKGNITITDMSKYSVTGTQQTGGKPLGSEVSLTEASQLKGGTTGYRIITITPAAAKDSTISYNRKTLKQGGIITGENGGTATVDSKNNTITLDNFKGNYPLEFNAEFTPNSITLIGDSTLSAVETKYQNLTISGSGSLTVGSIRVPNNTQNTANLTITGGAHVTVNRPSGEDEPAVEVSGNLTVTGDGTQLSAECTAATNPAIEVGGNVTISGNPGTNAYTVKAYNKYATPRGRDDKLRPSQMPSAIEISGDSLSISNSAQVMAKTDSDGAAVWMPKQKVISVVDASLIAQNRSHNFSTISFGDESNMGNIYAKGQVNIVAENMLGSNSRLAHRAIKAYIYNHYSTGDSNPYYIKVVSEGVQSGGNVNVIPGDCTSTGGYKVTITRGDAYVAPTKTITEIIVTGLTPPVKGATPVDKSKVTLTDGLTVESITWGPALTSDGKFAANTAYTAHINYSVKAGYELAANANCPQVAGANVTRWHQEGMPQDEIEVTFPKTAADTPTEKPTITLDLPAPVAGVAPVTTGVTATSSDNTPLTIDKVEWYAYTVEYNNGKFERIVEGDKVSGNFEANTYYFAEITFDRSIYFANEGLNIIAPTWPLEGSWPESRIYRVIENSYTARILFPATDAACNHQPGDWQDGTDGEHHVKVCAICHNVVATESHAFGGYQINTNNSHTRVCSVCNAAYTNAHEFNSYAHNENSHWKVCVCGATTSYANHEFDPATGACACGATQSGGNPTPDVPAAPTGLAGVAPTSANSKDGKITGTTAAMEYATEPNGSNWIECGGDEVTGLSAGTYYVRYKRTTDKPASAVATVVVPAYSGGGEIVPPTPDNPGTIVIIRPAEEEKPAQQPNPSTGANDLVGLAVAAAVAAALGSAALLRKHD